MRDSPELTDGRTYDDGETLEFLVHRADTLRGDLRDRMLERIQNLQKPWPQLSEGEQRELIEGIDRVARTLVQNTVRLVAAAGRVVIVGNLAAITVKDGIQANVKLPKTAVGRFELMDAVKQDVLLVVAGSDEFDGEQKAAEADPDQGDLLDQPVMDNTAAGAGDGEPQINA